MKINFNKNIYKKKAINNAIRQFKELADFKVSTKSDYYTVDLKNINKDVVDVIKDEFGNYVLYLMNL